MKVGLGLKGRRTTRLWPLFANVHVTFGHRKGVGLPNSEKTSFSKILSFDSLGFPTSSSSSRLAEEVRESE